MYTLQFGRIHLWHQNKSHMTMVFMLLLLLLFSVFSQDFRLEILKDMQNKKVSGPENNGKCKSLETCPLCAVVIISK